MAGRGPQSFKKRQKEMQRKERQQEKLAKRLQRKHEKTEPSAEDHDDTSMSVDSLEITLPSQHS
jgi:hypothetical protein